jgi:hypothetical protein
MAKELPYFKFYIGDWINGDITLESYEIQGLFINICSYYWSKDCDLSMINLSKKFRNDKDGISQLIESKIIKVIDSNVSISFLNEQYQSKEVQKITNKINGLKGGRPKKEETENKPNGLNFANRNETETKPNDNPNETNRKESKEDKNNNTPDKSGSIDYQKFIDIFNRFGSRNFRVTDKVKISLKARLKDYSKDQIIKAIELAHKDQFHIDSGFKHLTPEFILRPDKLEKFLNTPIKIKNNNYGAPAAN